jgi:hypothetical protein
MRDIPGFVDTRQQLLQLKSNVKGHWLGFAIAHHLNGNHALAVQILDSFEETQEEVPDNEQYEQSEMVMYKAMILKEGGQLEQALDLLQSNKVCSRNTCHNTQMALHTGLRRCGSCQNLDGPPNSAVSSPTSCMHESRQTGADVFTLHGVKASLHRLTIAAEAHSCSDCNDCASSCKHCVLAAQACMNVVKVISG